MLPNLFHDKNKALLAVNIYLMPWTKIVYKGPFALNYTNSNMFSHIKCTCIILQSINYHNLDKL